MDKVATGPIAAEIEARLRALLVPERLTVNDDSALHLGHAGHDARGESHFSIEILSSAFDGVDGLSRQRMVHVALADLLEERVHALTMRLKGSRE